MFGGGFAMLPLLQREIVERKHWATEVELADYFAVGQCTPGIIAVNTATFIGSKQKGILGGVVATLGLISPCIIIISLLALCLQKFQDNEQVQHAFVGVRACVCVLILNAVIKLARSSVVDVFSAVLFITVFVLSVCFGLSPALLVLLSGFIGLSIKLAQGRRHKS